MKKIKIPKDPRMLVYWYHLDENEDAIWIWYKDDDGSVKYTGMLANGKNFKPYPSFSDMRDRAYTVSPNYFTLIHAE